MPWCPWKDTTGGAKPSSQGCSTFAGAQSRISIERSCWKGGGEKHSKRWKAEGTSPMPAVAQRPLHSAHRTRSGSCLERLHCSFKGVLASLESPLKRAAFPKVNDLCLEEGVEGLRQTKWETKEKWYREQWEANSPGITNLAYAHTFCMREDNSTSIQGLVFHNKGIATAPTEIASPPK